jgi:hypothetical protein
LVEQARVDLVGQAHEAHCLVLDLSDQRFVVLALGCDQLRQEVLAVRLGHSLRLIVEHVGQVIVIFLLCGPDLDEGQHEHSRGKVHAGGRIDAADACESRGLLEVHLLEIHAQWIEAVSDIVRVCIAS